MASVIMISSPVGAGKTAVAQKLTAFGPGRSFIEDDRFWLLIVNPRDAVRRDDFRVLMRSMTAAAVVLDWVSCRRRASF
jgi:hypothetical protein